MRTTLDIDEQLLDDALRFARSKSKKGAIEEALTEFINARRREWLVSRLGKGDIDMSLDDLWKMRGCDMARAESKRPVRRRK